MEACRNMRSISLPLKLGALAICLTAGCGTDRRPSDPMPTAPTETNVTALRMYLKVPGNCYVAGGDPVWYLGDYTGHTSGVLLPIGLPYQPLVQWSGTNVRSQFRATFTINGAKWDSTNVLLTGDLSQSPDCAAAWAPPDTGVYQIGAILDDGNQIAESKEDDNQVTANVRFVLPNMRGAYVVVARDSLTAVTSLTGIEAARVGDSLHVAVSEPCFGAFPDYRFQLSLNGVVLQDGRTGCSQYPGSGFTLNASLACYQVWVPQTPGDYQIGFAVDVDGEYLESSETDNVTYMWFSVYP